MVVAIDLKGIELRLTAGGFRLKSASGADIETCEMRLAMSLPSPLASYLESIAGTDGLTIGHIRFHGTSELSTLNTALACSDHVHPNFIVIADYDDWMWAYAINVLEKNNPKVYATGSCSQQPRVVMDSLFDFLLTAIESPNSKALVPRDQ